MPGKGNIHDVTTYVLHIVGSMHEHYHEIILAQATKRRRTVTAHVKRIADAANVYHAPVLRTQRIKPVFKQRYAVARHRLPHLIAARLIIIVAQDRILAIGCPDLSQCREQHSHRIAASLLVVASHKQHIGFYPIERRDQLAQSPVAEPAFVMQIGNKSHLQSVKTLWQVRRIEVIMLYPGYAARFDSVECGTGRQQNKRQKQ